jgi:hypothetical protein
MTTKIDGCANACNMELLLNATKYRGVESITLTEYRKNVLRKKEKRKLKRFLLNEIWEIHPICQSGMGYSILPELQRTKENHESIDA